MTFHVGGMALDNGSFWFELSQKDVSPRSIKIHLSQTWPDGKVRLLRVGGDVMLALTEAGKPGSTRYIESSKADVYEVNASIGTERPLENYFSTIDHLTARIIGRQPHPRASALGALAERALVSQQSENRSVAQWAKDLANASFIR